MLRSYGIMNCMSALCWNLHIHLGERNAMKHKSVGAHRSICRIVAFLAAGGINAAGVAIADIMPAGTPSETRLAIQNAIDAAAIANPAGTVTLGNGTFKIDAQLMVTGGVALVGQGWDKTIIKQVATTASANTRVMTVDGGATVRGVAITGGRVIGSNYQYGGGVLIKDGV